MEYQKIINFLDNALNQPPKFRTKNWVEISNDLRETYNTNSQNKFKTSMLKLSLCDYSDAYTLVKGTVSIVSVPPPAENLNNSDKEVVFKNCASFTDILVK